MNVQKFDRDWVGARGMSGRRVVVKGLPPGMPVGAVREMARAYGLEEGFDAVIQLPQCVSPFARIGLRADEGQDTGTETLDSRTDGGLGRQRV